jgi:outer membrane lipoprotein-sorting protein
MIEKDSIPQEPLDPLIEQAIDAIRRTPVPPMPLGVQAEAVAKMQLAARQPQRVRFYERIRAMKPRNKLAAAASILIAVGTTIALIAVMTARPAIAFADVKEQLQKAKTIQMTMSMQVPAGPVSFEMRLKIFIKEPGLKRVEMEGGQVVIVDIPVKKMLMLDPAKKEAMLLDTGQIPTGDEGTSQNMLERIRKCLDGSEKPLEEKKIDGKPAEGFCVTKDSEEMEIWVDKASRNPVMIKMTSRLPGAPISNRILRDIVLDQEMPDSMFSLKPPGGYTLKQQALNMSDPVEADLVAGLRMLATSKDGKFPDNLSPGPELGSQAERAAKGKSDVEQQAMMQTYVRMVLFVSIQGKKNRFQYDGKGVKLGEAATPIAWWRQDDGSKYRVLYGDLSLKDLPADKLPATATAPASAQRPMPAPEPGLVRVQIIDSAGNNMSVGLLRPEVVVRIDENSASTTQPAELWTKGIGKVSGPTSKKVVDLVVRIDDPRGQRANLPVSGPVKIAVYDYEAGTLASVDNLSAGVTLSVKPKAGDNETANSELVVELRDAEGKTTDVTTGK